MTMPVSVKAFDGGRIKGAMIIPSCIEVDLVWNLASGKQVKNVLHGRVAPAFASTAAIAQAVYAALIASASWTAWAALLPTTVSLANISLRDLRSLNLPFVTSTGAATAGTSVSAALPPGASLVVTERTNFAGRGFRGRVYLTGLASNVLVTGTGALTGAANTAAVNFLTAVQTALTSSGITLTLAQRARNQYIGRTGTTIPARAASFVDVTSFNTKLTALTSQRRRSYVA